MYAMISDSVAELTEAKGVSPDGAVFAVTSPVTATPFDWSSSANFVATSLAACWDSSGYPAGSSGVGRRRRIERCIGGLHQSPLMRPA